MFSYIKLLHNQSLDTVQNGSKFTDQEKLAVHIKTNKFLDMCCVVFCCLILGGEKKQKGLLAPLALMSAEII